jgi:hypothetical protein
MCEKWVSVVRAAEILDSTLGRVAGMATCRDRRLLVGGRDDNNQLIIEVASIERYLKARRAGLLKIGIKPEDMHRAEVAVELKLERLHWA